MPKSSTFIDDTYSHPCYGVGVIISRKEDGTVAVRFPDPPRMAKNFNKAGRRIGLVPTMIFKPKMSENV